MSRASNLVPSDTNKRLDYFVWDLAIRQIDRVSVTSEGEQAIGPDDYVQPGEGPAISGDGRRVAFESEATNLVPGDDAGMQDIFVHDLETRGTARVSVGSGGEQANGYSFAPAISADGRHVAFESNASNLTSDDTNGVRDVFLHDLVLGTTELVSLALDGGPANDRNERPAVSADGRFVVFGSNASNLVAGDTNEQADIFVRDRLTGITRRVSVSSEGSQANSWSTDPAISADGRFVAFLSRASNLVLADPHRVQDVFVHDVLTRETTLVSVDALGLPFAGQSESPSISADGRFVGFTAPREQPGPTTFDAWVHDRLTGQTSMVSISPEGLPADDHTPAIDVSGTGRFVVMGSGASNLDPPDTNGEADVYFRDRGEITCASGVREEGSTSQELHHREGSAGSAGPLMHEASCAAGRLGL